MNIDMIPITKDYCVEDAGTYLIRTESAGPLKTVRFMSASVHRHFNEKENKFVMSIGVTNQIVTHISKERL